MECHEKGMVAKTRVTNMGALTAVRLLLAGLVSFVRGYSPEPFLGLGLADRVSSFSNNLSASSPGRFCQHL
jgi:hypothetical protein